MSTHKKIFVFSMLASAVFLFAFIEPVKAEIERITLRVDGLSCPFCAYGLEKKITAIKGTLSYDVDMKEGRVFLGLKPDAKMEIGDLYKAVKEAGFTLRSIYLRVKGEIEQSEEGLVLIAKGTKERFLLFENDALRQMYHKGEPPKSLENELQKKLVDVKGKGVVVSIEGFVHEHKGFSPALSVDHLEITE